MFLDLVSGFSRAFLIGLFSQISLCCFLLYCFLSVSPLLHFDLPPSVNFPDCLHLRHICSFVYLSLIFPFLVCWIVCCFSVLLPIPQYSFVFLSSRCSPLNYCSYVSFWFFVRNTTFCWNLLPLTRLHFGSYLK